MLDDRLYVVDDGAKLYVFDAKTGEQIARKKLGTHARDEHAAGGRRQDLRHARATGSGTS